MNQLLYKGKAKSLFAAEKPDKVIVEFRDDATAFNGEKHALIEGKGALNNQINAFIMNYLNENNIKTHFIKLIDNTHSLTQHLNMIPLECVVRNVTAGSLCKRLGVEKGKKLISPIFEFYLKDDALGDPLITESQLIALNFSTKEQIDKLKRASLTINDLLIKLFSNAGLTLVDFKLEFGLMGDELILGDEISPDGCRIWQNTTVLDKDRFRFDLGDLIEGYQQIATALGIKLN